MPVDQVVVLLIRQLLDRWRVVALLPAGQPQRYRELPHDRLAGTGRGAYQHARSVLQGSTRLDLEVIELERVLPSEFRYRRMRGPHSAGCISLCRRRTDRRSHEFSLSGMRSPTACGVLAMAVTRRRGRDLSAGPMGRLFSVLGEDADGVVAVEAVAAPAGAGRVGGDVGVVVFDRRRILDELPWVGV